MRNERLFQLENSPDHGKKERRYSADDIEIVTGLEAIRRRPAMYLGRTDLFGLMHYFAESISIMLSHQARVIELTIEQDTYLLSSDANFNLESEATLHAYFEVIFSTSWNDGIPAILNALSEQLRITITSAEKQQTVRYGKGERLSSETQACRESQSGVTFQFKPDGSIFSVTQIPRGMIASYLRRMSYLHPGVRFSFTDDQNSLLFYSAHGLLDLFEATTTPYPLLHQPVHLTASVEELSLELVFAYQQGRDNLLVSFMNGLPALGGGTHEEGLREAFPEINSVLGLSADFPYGYLALAALQYPHVCWGGDQRQKVSFDTELKEQLREGIVREVEQWAAQNPEIVAELRLIPT